MLKMLTEVNVCVSETGLSPKELKLLLGEDYAFLNAFHFNFCFILFHFSFLFGNILYIKYQGQNIAFLQM